VRVVDQLSAAEQEGSELIVIETPDTVGASRFEIVCGLDDTHNAEVARKDDESELWEGGLRKDVETVQAQQPDEEIEFVTGAVINTSLVAK
jgi:hypothetical protein